MHLWCAAGASHMCGLQSFLGAVVQPGKVVCNSVNAARLLQYYTVEYLVQKRVK